MGIKSKIKSIFTHKEYIPITHPISIGKEFENKVALVSGGSGSIGLAIVTSLQEVGCKVIIAGTNSEKLE